MKYLAQKFVTLLRKMAGTTAQRHNGTTAQRHNGTLFLLISILGLFLPHSCKKELTQKDSTFSETKVPTLNIERAKVYFNTKLYEMKLEKYGVGQVHSRDNVEDIQLDWANATNYFDEIKNQSVVEVPIINSTYSKTFLNSNDGATSTLEVLNLPQIHKLVIVEEQDLTLGYAIMKISNSYQYFNSTTAEVDSNDYQLFEPQFKGILTYVDLNDMPLTSYFGSDGQWYPLEDSIPTSNANGVNSRGEICFILWGLGLESCYCSGCIECWRESYICFPVNAGGGSSGNSGGTAGSSPPPIPGGLSALQKKIKAFNDTYDTDLTLDLVYESECEQLAGASFDNCSMEALIADFQAQNPSISLSPTEITWLKGHFDVFKSLKEYVNVNHPISTQKTNLFKLHLNTMVSDPTYFGDISSKGFPVLGTEAWANSFVFRLETTKKATPGEVFLTLLYPKEALLIRINVIAARNYQTQFYGTGGENVRWLGKGDAFLHTMWHALNASDVGRDIAKEFGDAHESETPQALYLESDMDYWNNEQGYQIGEDNPASPDVSQAAIVPIVQAAITNGLCKYLDPVDHVLSPEYTDGLDPKALNGLLLFGIHGVQVESELKFTNE